MQQRCCSPGYGFSALAICGSGRRPKAERRHIVIDPHQRRYWHNLGLTHLRKDAEQDAREIFFHRPFA